MSEKNVEKVEALIAKAADADSPSAAMQFAQAAANAANALLTVHTVWPRRLKEPAST